MAEKITIIKDDQGKQISLSAKALPKKVLEDQESEILENAGETGLKQTLSSSKLKGSNRQAEHWSKQLVVEYSKLFRKGKPLPASFKPSNPQFLIDTFKIKGFEYGQWLNQADRQNYLFALGASLYDLSKLSGLPLNFMGLNNLLGVCFGSRGRGSASAHFESRAFIINLTRHKENENLQSIFDTYPKDYPKAWRFMYTSGIASYAHEFGHAIDFYFGLYIEGNKNKKGYNTALSFGRESFSTPRIIEGKPLTALMEKLMNKIMWNDDQTEYTPFYTDLKKLAEIQSDYWIRRTEIFARAFEQYIQYQAEKAGFTNAALTQNKYKGSDPMYMTKDQLERVMPEMKALLKAMAKTNLLKNE